jgi:cysteine-rich repeat protein
MGSACVDTAAESCPGFALTLNPGRTRILDTTTGHASDLVGSCVGTGSEDLVYAVTASETGTMLVRLTSAGWDAGVYVRSSCATSGSEIGCSNVPRAGAEEALNVTVLRGATYYVVVDGQGGADGAFMLMLELQSTCGNRTIDTGETCDDGNATAGDGCDATCQLEATAGSACPADAAALALAPGTQVYTGDSTGPDNAVHGTCAASSTADEAIFRVRPTQSGHLRVDLTPESAYDPVLFARASCPGSTDIQCADANGSGQGETVEFDVTAGTIYTVVADGFTGSDEGPFQLTFLLTSCGNGTLDGGTEQCDDGNAVSGDGCSATCQIEASCIVTESGATSYNSPQTLPACERVLVTGSITPVGESDFYLLHLRAGQILELDTYTNNMPGTCGAGVDTVLEIFRSPLASDPTNGDCSATTALECEDDPNAPNLCAALFHEIPADGDYVVRIFDSLNNATITNYGLRATIK